ncbi:hypothetical protein K4F52_004904 [Lecanicillium sp. MT-2017a]|nr:hypothetical protein K4F52_004904 [Lecanicillium sp. MT-2017a]
MTLSTEQLKIIAEHPLKDELFDIRSGLRDIVLGTDAWRRPVLILLARFFHPLAAHHLHLRDGGQILPRLLEIHRDTTRGMFDFDHFRPLVDAVVSKPSDIDVWAALVDLIEVNRPLAAPASSSTSFTASSRPISSQFDYSEADKISQRGLFKEFKNCTHRGVPGFVDKHFDVTKWTGRQKKALHSVLTHHDGTRWQNFPNDCSNEAVLEWLLSLQDALDGVQQVLSERQGNVDFKQYKRQACMVFQRPGQDSGNLDSRSVVVVGKHEAGTHPTDFRMVLVQLTRQIQSIFAEQPLRRFVHAFTIKQTMMELWVFDRSGPYSSGEFDIHREREKFARAFVAYATMDDAAMGLNIYTEEQQGHRNITVKDFDNNHIRTALNKPLVRQRGLVCRGTTCFLTDLGVAKFSWLADKQPSEAKLL